MVSTRNGMTAILIVNEQLADWNLMTIESIYNTLERLCNLLRVAAREAGAAEGLLPIQLEALHYLVQCNRYSDTVQGVSEFLGQTKGTVSKTLSVLENRGYIVKQSDAKDRRIVHLRTSATGQRVLEKAIPPKFLVQALNGTDSIGIEELERKLRDVLLAAQRMRASKSFGACKTCRFNQASDSQFRCGLTREELSLNETELICREHEYAN